MVGDLGVGAAHDAGQADRTAVVGDDEVLGVQLPLDAVEGDDLLALLRAAHADGALDLVAVVGVQRLAELHHHVVGDVDGEEIGRMPTFCSRRWSQIGERASGLRPVTVRTVKRSQPMGSETFTG